MIMFLFLDIDNDSRHVVVPICCWSMILLHKKRTNRTVFAVFIFILQCLTNQGKEHVFCDLSLGLLNIEAEPIPFHQEPVIVDGN